MRSVAASSLNVTNFAAVNDGNALAQVGTSPNGRFAARIEVPDFGTGVVDVRVEATAPDGSAAIRTLRLRS